MEENDTNIEALVGDDELATKGIREVIQGNAGVWLSPLEVDCVAFVIHLGNITEDKYGSLNGIYNVFFVRYSFVTGSVVLLEHFNQFINLTKSHSYSYRIFRPRYIL